MAKSNEDQRVIANFVAYLNSCINALDHEFGSPFSKAETLRNTDRSGVYVLRDKDNNVQVEITFNVLKKDTVG